MFRPCDHDSNPSLHLYLYSQMTTFVGLSSGSHVTEALYSMLRMQPPTINSMVGLCVTESLTATSKISLSAGLQLCVALGMIAAYLIGVGCTACLRSSHVRCFLVAMRTVPLMLSQNPTVGLGCFCEPYFGVCAYLCPTVVAPCYVMLGADRDVLQGSSCQVVD